MIRNDEKQTFPSERRKIYFFIVFINLMQIKIKIPKITEYIRARCYG